MLYCKGRGESFVTPFLCFVVIRRNLRHIPKSKLLGTVLLVLSPSSLFCDAPHLTPSDNKTVCIVQNFAAFWQQNGLYRAKFLQPSDNKTDCGFVGSFDICLEFEMLIYKSYSVDSFYPFRTLLTFDILARKSPIFFICYTKSIPSIVNILKALCKKMRKKNHTMRK